MSKRTDVLFALKALLQGALPGADVLGLDGGNVPPGNVSEAGRVIIDSGDPGDPEIDLSPITYNYDHRIPIEAISLKDDGFTSEEALDLILVAVGAAIEADRTLGGLCHWLDATAPATEDIWSENAPHPPRGANVVITASYSSPHPLT